MNDDDISKLVELANSLVYEKTGTHLEDVEEAILKQTLTGKKNTAIQFKGFAGSYVQRLLAPKLWKLLSEATGEKVHKRNVRRVLERLQSQPMQLGVASRGKYLAKAQAKSNGRVVFDSLLLHTELTNAQNILNSPDFTLHDSTTSSTRVSYCINPDCTNRRNPSHYHYCVECGTPSPVDGRLPKPLQAEQAESNKSGNSSTNSTEGEPQPSSQTSQPNNSGETKSISDGLPTLIYLINFLKPGRVLLLSLGVLGCLFGWSWLANWYGVTNHLRGQLSKAEFGYSWALKLNPLSAAAHYNQGGIYEDQQNYKRAHAKYQLAIEGGLVEAYNNQARLYILEGNYDAATSLLRIGLPLTKDPQVKASMYKNLGWAGLEQGDLAPARFYLTQAIKLKSDCASPFCLLAQLLEREGDKKGALVIWQNCLAFNAQELPEEAKWYFEARKRLEASGAE